MKYGVETIENGQVIDGHKFRTLDEALRFAKLEQSRGWAVTITELPVIHPTIAAALRPWMPK